MADYQKIRQELEGIAVEDNPALVRQKSRDFYWYSPILKAQLDNVTADIVVTPKNEAEVHDRIEAILKCVYPDLLRKPPVTLTSSVGRPTRTIGSNNSTWSR